MRLFHTFVEGSAVFDEDNLFSVIGLVPVMTLAEQTGLTSMVADKVVISSPRIKPGSASLAPKMATLIAGMTAGADCIDDIDLLREHLLALSARADAARRPEQGAGRNQLRYCARPTGIRSRARPTVIRRSQGKQVLRKGLSPLVATLSTDLGTPVVAGMRLRAGKTVPSRVPRRWSPPPRHRPRRRGGP